MILMLLWNTNNKMAAPAPVQLQQQVTVSDLVFCVFVYGRILEDEIPSFHQNKV